MGVSTRRSCATCSSCHPLAGSGETPVYAVDTSVWPRCDAECSPERGYYYHPSRHSAGQPIVAGWAYQFVAQLNFVRESWTAPVDVQRLRPAQDANVVATEQVSSLLYTAPTREGPPLRPLFVFDAGYDPVKVQQGLEGCPCQILLRLRAGRRFYGDPGLCDPPEHIGRPRRHGPKMKCSEPSTWPEPSAEHRCEDAGYGSVRVRAWAEMHPKVSNHAGKGTRGPLPIVVGTLILVEVERLPRGERRREPRVLWLWWHGPEGMAPDLDLLWRAYVRRFDLEHTFRFLKQSMGWRTPRVRHPEQADRWTWLVLAAFTQLRLARAHVADLRLPWERHYDPGQPYARAGPPGSFGAFDGAGHAGQAAETLREVSRKTQRAPLRQGQALPGAQKERLSQRRQRPREVLGRSKARTKTSRG